MTNIRPGLQPEMTGAAYHAAPGISKSKLDDFAEASPLHYWDKHINPDKPVEERTEALILGDAIHAAVGEPDTVSSRFVVIPDDAPKRPTKAQINAKSPSLESRGAISYWKAFNEENEGKIILKPSQMEIVLACRDSAWGDPEVAGLLYGAKFEQTYYATDPDTGALRKCRLDGDRVEEIGVILDIKSAEDASEDAFYGHALKYRYNVQDPWYSDTVDLALGGKAVEQFAFIVLEKGRPYATAIYYLGADEIAAGREKARADLRGIVHYTETYGDQKWPSYTENGARRLRSRRERAQS